jgi:uncharacterized membrane protein
MDKTLTGFIWIWISLILLLNTLGIVGFFIHANSFWGGMQKVWDIYSPFNIINWVVELATLSPAIGAYFWRERRRRNTAQATA